MIMNKVIVNQLGSNFLVPAEHAAKFNRRSELVLLAIDLENAISEVLNPEPLQKHLKQTMEKIRRINRRIPDGCAEYIGRV